MTEPKALTVVDTVRKMEPEFKAALPAHITPEKFTRVAVSALNSSPDILKGDVDRRSLLAAIMKAAQDGLVLDGREAALVTFNTKEGKKAQMIPMVAGVLKKMRNSGEISTISTGLVYRKEYESGRFRFVKGDTENLTHDPILFDEKGDMIGVYAVVTLKDGGKIREFMDMTQLAKVRKASKTGTSQFGPWATWFEEMCTKSVLKKVAKLCPQSSDLEQVIHDDDDTPGSQERTAPVIDAGAIEVIDQPERPKRQTRAAAAVKAAVTDQSAEPAPPTQPADADIMDAEFSDISHEAEFHGHGDEPPM